ncbi:MAG: S4 domain-containing protein [[Clostridium] leptum]
MERLDKILSSQGVGSRKEAGILIRRGLVHVNGILATRPETKTDPERDQITIEGKPLRFQRHVYLMMNKPAGVVSASRDSREKTVVDWCRAFRRDLFPARRLDGYHRALILTDDEAFAHRGRAGRSREIEIRRRCGAGGRYGVPACGLTGKARDCLGNPGGNQGGKFHQVKKMFWRWEEGCTVETGANRRPGTKTLKEGNAGADKEELALIFKGKQAFCERKFKWSNLTKFPKLV